MRRFLTLAVMKPSILVGGQAVIEGVMMRVPGAYATAVRDPDGEVQVDRHEFVSRIEQSDTWKKPILRGIISLFEAMRIGFRTLQWSADIAVPSETPEKQPGKLANFFSTAIAIVLAVSLFMVAPYWITNKLLHLGKDALAFNLAAGLLRILFFILYLAIISLLKDVRRLFQNHGAEHRVVYNFESGREVTVEEAQTFPTQHPRCGTSFLFIVLLSAILVFALIDTVAIALVGPLPLFARLALHLPLIPFVAGVSYEVIKFSSRHGDKPLVRILRAPGLWLQNITTRPPEDEMVEVAITALKSAFGERYEKVVGKEYLAEAIG
ncbi:MAG: DUF1385 domain-containing protein [FCB group bacterium]|nr:DUF1385 domain-containing protein [FCB group bacterium]